MISLLRVPAGLLFRWPLQPIGGFDWNVSLIFSTFALVPYCGASTLALSRLMLTRTYI